MTLQSCYLYWQYVVIVIVVVVTNYSIIIFSTFMYKIHNLFCLVSAGLTYVRPLGLNPALLCLLTYSVTLQANMISSLPSYYYSSCLALSWNYVRRCSFSTTNLVMYTLPNIFLMLSVDGKLSVILLSMQNNI